MSITETITGSTRVLDETHGAVRVEGVYDTDLADLWSACTEPERLARWIAEVSGEPRVGATVQATFTSTWTGPVRVESCDPPRHLLLTSGVDTDEEAQIEAWLSEEPGGGARLVVEERGLPRAELHFHGAGWQAHLEDLQLSIVLGHRAHDDGWSAERPAAGWHARWTQLMPSYPPEEHS